MEDEDCREKSHLGCKDEKKNEAKEKEATKGEIGGIAIRGSRNC